MYNDRKKSSYIVFGGDNMKYFINATTGTLHKLAGCRFSKVIPSGAKCYKSEDEAIKAETRYFKHCKWCFKEKK